MVGLEIYNVSFGFRVSGFEFRVLKDTGEGTDKFNSSTIRQFNKVWRPETGDCRPINNYHIDLLL